MAGLRDTCVTEQLFPKQIQTIDDLKVDIFQQAEGFPVMQAEFKALGSCGSAVSDCLIHALMEVHRCETHATLRSAAQNVINPLTATVLVKVPQLIISAKVVGQDVCAQSAPPHQALPLRGGGGRRRRASCATDRACWRACRTWRPSTCESESASPRSLMC